MLSFPGTHTGLQQMDSGLGDPRDIQGETKLCDFRTRAEGKVAIVLVLSSHSMWPMGECHLSSTHMNKYEFSLPW